ncbi:unnamed protein product [Leptosia nina]|uniref:Apyrase n=1 Tax=Leptosia nina TaxID=320188 RepID=A0AAV1IWN7_9NEOP
MPNKNNCIGGLSRLYTGIKQALEVEPNSLLLNGGDTFQGTVWYNFMRWNVSQHFMNLLPKHDAHVLGNHEFSHGIKGLLPYLERLRAPMLGANVNTTFEPELGKHIKNHVIVERNGHKIGDITLYFDTEGKITSWNGRPIYLGTSIVKDEQMESLLNEWRAELYPISREVLGRSLVQLDPGSCYSGECNLGSWICDAFLEQMMARANNTNWNHAHLCLLTVGGLRSQINAGDITTEGLLMALPFENQLVAYDLKGKYILEALEYSVGGVLSNPRYFVSRRMLQIGGMRNVYNASAPIGSRVASTRVRCIDCDIPHYVPLNPESMYRIISQNFLGNGGSGFTMISENRENIEFFGEDFIFLQRHMRKTTIFYQELDGRIQIVY